MEYVSVREKIDKLYKELTQNASTFIYNPDGLKKITQQIFELQNKCHHHFENGECIYCRKAQGNADEEKRYL